MQTSTLDSNLLITEAYAAYRILGAEFNLQMQQNSD